VLTDLEIARAAHLDSIDAVAARAGIVPEELEHYGSTVAKVSLDIRERLAEAPKAHYVAVTAVTPTPLGEGKTTTAVGLAQGMEKLGKRSMLTLRQPSMGPTFGIKGGAAGGGYSQVLPMEKLNLHLTGDFHAIGAAHNLLAAMIDNHIFQGNELDIEPSSIMWRRVVDMNDRALRNIIVGLGGRLDGVPRQSGFDITSASEVGVILSLATSRKDLRERLGRIVIGLSKSGEQVTAEQIGAAGAMAVLLDDALRPNLLQTTENTPVLIHTGPFGNIATGNSSVVADQVGLKCADYVITESGFGSDMGFERLVNLKCRVSGLTPSAAVIVVTIRALKSHSGRFTVVAGKPLPEEMLADDPQAVLDGADNLRAHIRIVKGFGVEPVVAVNVFPTDHEDEIAVVQKVAEEEGARSAVSTHVVNGGEGAKELAAAVIEACENNTNELKPSYNLSDSITEKIEAVATKVYGAAAVTYDPPAKAQIARFEKLGYSGLPVIIAKTQLSLSSDAKLKGAPTGWTLPIRDLRLAAGAGYIYAIAGDIRTMPGLSKHPAAERIDIDENGEITGLF
jgi:formate--tetrahydrofolate ligase